MNIRTRRFTLREFTEADAAPLTAYQSDPRYVALYGAEQANPEKSRELLTLFQSWACETPRVHYQLAVVLNAQPGELVGCCGIRNVDVARGRAELGVELAPSQWGRHGYAIEIMRAMAEFAFGELGLREIYGITTSANSRVTRLAKFFGAELVETRAGLGWAQEQGASEVEWRLRLGGYIDIFKR